MTHPLHRPTGAGRCLLLILAGTAACIGSITDGGTASNESPAATPGAGGKPGGVEPPPPGSVVLPPTPAGEGPAPWNPGPSSLRHLTQHEYESTVKSLFAAVPSAAAIAEQVAGALPPDEGQGFDTEAAGLIATPKHARGYHEAALVLADLAARNLPALVPCSGAGGDEGCARTVAQRFGRRAFRRPLEPTEVDGLLQSYRGARAMGSPHEEALTAVFQRILQSPHFLYLVERGVPVVGDARLRTLTHHEVAARLSYLFWRDMPDDALFATADQQGLHDLAQIEAQARRLLADPRARPAIARFHEQWLELAALDNASRDEKIVPGFSIAKAEIKEQIKTFVNGSFWDDGSVGALMSAPYTYLSKSLATWYGVPAPAGAGLVKSQPNPERYAGLLTQPGLWLGVDHQDGMAILQRGKVVRQRLLCLSVPEPDPNDPEINMTIPPPKPGVSTRQSVEGLGNGSAKCQACHVPMIQAGAPTTLLDIAGRWQTTERGSIAIDASGGILHSKTSDTARGQLVGPAALGRHLGATGEAADCLALQWFRFAFGRQESPDDEPTLAWLSRRFKDDNHDIRKLLVRLVATPTFRLAPGHPGGVP